MRNWFSRFTLLRNKTRGHGAILPGCCSEACTHLEKSIELIVDNFYAFKRHWAYLHQNQSGKYRVSEIANRELKEFDYLKSNSSESYTDGIYYYLDAPRRVKLMLSDSDLTDFFMSNGNLSDGQYELISYISGDKKFESSREYSVPITNLPGSQTEGKRKVDGKLHSFTNLPDIGEEYISRKSLEKELTNVLLEHDRYPIITLRGRGGIGKTSLAIKVLKEILETDRFELVIWFSARDVDLLMEGPKQVRSQVLNQKDISKEYCNLVHENTIIDHPIELFSSEMTINPFNRALFVFDNFETLTNPEEIFEWLNTYIRNPNKILITSRISRNFKADYPIEIRGMEEEESRELIKIFSSKLNIQTKLTSDFAEELITESNGHPYIIKVLLGEIAKTGKIIKVERFVSGQEDILIALFQRTFNNLPANAKRVFLTLCSWNSMLPLIALEAVLWRQENEKIDIEGAIEQLRMSSFIELIKEKNEEYVYVPLAAQSFGKSELKVSPDKIKIFADRKLLMEFGVSRNSNLSSGVISRIEQKFKNVANRVDNIEDFQSELPTLEYIASKYPRAYYHIIDVFEEFGDAERSKYYHREFLKQQLPDDERIKLWIKLAELCRKTSDWGGESQALLEIILIKSTPFRQISEAVNRINNYYFNNPEIKTSYYTINFAEKIIDVMIDRINEGDATDYSRLGWLLVNHDQRDDAKMIAEKGLHIDPENHYCKKLLSKLSLL